MTKEKRPNKNAGSTCGPLISVITTVYNAENDLEQTILSVINQSHANIEFIIIDGGSTDNTLAIIKKYGHKIKYWVSEKDNGVYDAMQKGISVARGAWVYFLGAGDLMLNVIHKIVPDFKDNSAIYYANVYKMDELKVYDGQYSGFKLAIKNICHQAIFYPRIVFDKYKFNPKYRMLADHEFNMRCFGDGSFKFIYLPVIVCIYEGGGISALNSDIPFFADKLQIIRSNFSYWVYLYAYIRHKFAKILKPGQENQYQKN